MACTLVCLASAAKKIDVTRTRTPNLIQSPPEPKPEPAPPSRENIPASVTIPVTGPASSKYVSPYAFHVFPLDGIFSRGDYSSLHQPEPKPHSTHNATNPIPLLLTAVQGQATDGTPTPTNGRVSDASSSATSVV